jgi:hypothetical protein
LDLDGTDCYCTQDGVFFIGLEVKNLVFIIEQLLAKILTLPNSQNVAKQLLVKCTLHGSNDKNLSNIVKTDHALKGRKRKKEKSKSAQKKYSPKTVERE